MALDPTSSISRNRLRWRQPIKQVILSGVRTDFRVSYALGVSHIMMGGRLMSVGWMMVESSLSTTACFFLATSLLMMVGSCVYLFEKKSLG